ncbi:MAG: hypothetical protein HY053_04305 [Proteobacteria bacterium]|nr:hypothetical protein [Pseudomonadota bacterium]
MTQPLALFEEIEATHSSLHLRELGEDLAYLQARYPELEIKFSRESIASHRPPHAESHMLAHDICFIPEHPKLKKPVLILRKTAAGDALDDEEIARVARAARMAFFIPAWLALGNRRRIGRNLGLVKYVVSQPRLLIFAEAYAAAAGFIAAGGTKSALPLLTAAMLRHTPLEKNRRDVRLGNHGGNNPFLTYSDKQALNGLCNDLLGSFGEKGSPISFVAEVASWIHSKPLFYELVKSTTGTIPASFYERAAALPDSNFKAYVNRLRALEQTPAGREVIRTEMQLLALCADWSPYAEESPNPPKRLASDPVALPGQNPPTQWAGELVTFTPAPQTGKVERIAGGKVIDSTPHALAWVASGKLRLPAAESEPEKASLPLTPPAAPPATPASAIVDMKTAGAALKERSASVVPSSAVTGQPDIVIFPGVRRERIDDPPKKPQKRTPAGSSPPEPSVAETDIAAPTPERPTEERPARREPGQRSLTGRILAFGRDRDNVMPSDCAFD